MKILIDTNIILDVLLKREPFYKAAIEVLNLAKKDNVQEYVSASAITDIYYLSYRQLKNKKLAKELLKELLAVVSVSYVSEQEISKALELEWNDFEDSVQYSVALLQEMNCIVMRNVDDYKESEIQVWLPEQVLKAIEMNEKSLSIDS